MMVTLPIYTSEGQSFCCCERGVQLDSAIGERERDRDRGREVTSRFSLISDGHSMT